MRGRRQRGIRDRGDVVEVVQTPPVVMVGVPAVEEEIDIDVAR